MTITKYIKSDRLAIMKELKKNKDFSNINLTELFDKIDYPKEIQLKQRNFRKVSAYLAFCSEFRNRKRDTNGKLNNSVLEITKDAGNVWATMTQNEKKSYNELAEKMTIDARRTFEIESKANETIDKIDSMKQNRLSNLALKYDLILPVNYSIREKRELLKTHLDKK